jgi:hypothetical protein
MAVKAEGVSSQAVGVEEVEGFRVRVIEMVEDLIDDLGFSDHRNNLQSSATGAQ